MVYQKDARQAVSNTWRSSTQEDELPNQDQSIHAVNATVISNKTTYKQHHYHEFSVITSYKHMDEEYAKNMFIEIYKQSRQKKTPGHENRFMMFMINYYAERTSTIMTKAGCTALEIDDAYDYFDNTGQRAFDQPDVRQLP
eukprot:539207-Amphidinium_carterae.3